MVMFETPLYRKENPPCGFVRSARRSFRSVRTQSSLQVSEVTILGKRIPSKALSSISGIQVSCPYLYCNSKNSQFQNAGRFPSGKKSQCSIFGLFSLHSYSHMICCCCSDIPHNLGSSSLLVNLGSGKICMKLITVTPSAFLSGRLHLFIDSQ